MNSLDQLFLFDRLDVANDVSVPVIHQKIVSTKLASIIEMQRRGLLSMIEFDLIGHRWIFEFSYLDVPFKLSSPTFAPHLAALSTSIAVCAMNNGCKVVAVMSLRTLRRLVIEPT